MKLYVLDTDHVTLFQRAHPLVVQHIAAVETEALAVTVVTAEEQLRGWLGAIRRASSAPRLVWAYAGLHAAMDYFSGVCVLDFDQTAHTCYEELRRQKIRVGTQDLRIAAIVLSVDGILVTRNQRDFAQVPGLMLQDWTIP
jgi:tRNA(fMet)-specific endonuclease VapC